MEDYNGDLEKTALLDELFETPPDNRDENWKSGFLENITDASLASGDPQVILGPDNFPYFHLIMPEPNKAFQCYVIRHMAGDFLLKEGFGVVINPAKGDPDWVFSYGDIVNLHLSNSFYSDPAIDPEETTETNGATENVLTGNPSESYLPALARTVIRNYLGSLGVIHVKILLMNRVRHGQHSQELVFNLTPDKFVNDAEYERIMPTMSWFLPRHYKYSSTGESAFPDGFINL